MLQGPTRQEEWWSISLNHKYSNEATMYISHGPTFGNFSCIISPRCVCDPRSSILMGSPILVRRCLYCIAPPTFWTSIHLLHGLMKHSATGSNPYFISMHCMTLGNPSCCMILPCSSFHYYRSHCDSWAIQERRVDETWIMAKLPTSPGLANFSMVL